MWLIGLQMSIAFLLKIRNILFCTTVTDRGKSWVKDVSCFVFQRISFHSPPGHFFFLLFSASSNFWKPKSLPKPHATSIVRRGRHDLGLQDILLCCTHLVQGGFGDDFQGGKAANCHLRGRGCAKTQPNVATVIYTTQNAVHLETHSHF